MERQAVSKLPESNQNFMSMPLSVPPTEYLEKKTFNCWRKSFAGQLLFSQQWVVCNIYIDSIYVYQESVTSSPEISFDLNGGHASTSPKPVGLEGSTSSSSVGQQQPTSNGNGNGNGTSTGQPPQTQTPSSAVARSRLMFDPLTELPVLEKWFEENPHPTWIQV